ncbi:glycosyltransferase [Flavobacteriaceae bacterium]|nr:glycosyltransferase [Flavobacteriaceae bacterium]
MKELAPIVLFVYNRLDHTIETINALKNNYLAEKSILFIYSDAPKKKKDIESVSAVRNYINKTIGFKKTVVIERKNNWGLANSIIDGVTTIVNKYDKIIVLEDDLVTSPYFLNFMNEGLDIYSKDEDVASLHGYLYPLKKSVPSSFFIKGTDCWGWATWQRAWEIFEKDGSKLLNELKKSGRQKEADFNYSYNYTKMLKAQVKGANDSWAIRWYISTFLKNKLTLYPGKSLVSNIGMDYSGIHNGSSKKFIVDLDNNYKPLNRINIKENKEVREYFEAFFWTFKLDFIPRIINKLRTNYVKYFN